MTLVLRPNPFQVKMFTHRVQECSVVLDADCSLSRGALYAHDNGDTVSYSSRSCHDGDKGDKQKQDAEQRK